MTQEEIIEGNNLIYRFMKDNIMEADISFYMSDWSMLMPVVEKIDQVHFSDFDNINLWVLEEEKRKVLELPIRTKIHKVWLAVVEFIKFYNHHK